MARFVPFIVDAGDNQKIGVQITRMKKPDAAQTEKEPHWQTSWMSEYIQSNSFEKYALKTAKMGSWLLWLRMKYWKMM